MAKERKSDFKMPSVDDLFSTQEQRNEDRMTSGKIMNISINEIDEFEGHPFKVLDDEAMESLMESIKAHGVIEPATVRKKENGRYEMISGHRRMHASQRLGFDTIRCEIVDISRDAAILQMVESNYHRERILPSEKAKAYKMRLEAIKRQNTLSPLGTGYRSTDMLTRETGDSKNQIYRYIALTNLMPELLDLVDNSVIKDKGMLQIALRPAVELSYLTKEEQEVLYEAIEDNQRTPSHAQAIRLRTKSSEGTLTDDDIYKIMCEEKPNEKDKPFLPKKIMSVLPAGMNNQEDIINLICDLLQKHQSQDQRKVDSPLKGQKEITDYKEMLPQKKKMKEDYER